MNTVTNVEITNGVKADTGKAWTRYDATLDNGVVASGFEFVKIGDVVDIVQKGEFINYKKIGSNVPNQRKTFVPPANPPLANGTDRSLRIERQHSQEMALRLFAMMGGTPGEPKDMMKKIRETTSWFQRDIGTNPQAEPEPRPSTEEEISTGVQLEDPNEIPY